jgi:hypothetical protein
MNFLRGRSHTLITILTGIVLFAAPVIGSSHNHFQSEKDHNCQVCVINSETQSYSPSSGFSLNTYKADYLKITSTLVSVINKKTPFGNHPPHGPPELI